MGANIWVSDFNMTCSRGQQVQDERFPQKFRSGDAEEPLDDRAKGSLIAISPISLRPSPYFSIFFPLHIIIDMPKA